MNLRLHPIFSPKRIAAEVLARINYRLFQNLYWRLRSPDLSRRYAYTNDFPVLEEILRSIQARNLLDIGCGYGRLFELYRRMGAREVIGLEFSDALINAARRKADDITVPNGTRFSVKKQDLRQPMPDLPALDLVVSNRVLQHIHPKDIGILTERLAGTGVKWLYLNELLTGVKRAPYVFVHDYVKLFSIFGFRERTRGTVAGLAYEYLVLER